MSVMVSVFLMLGSVLIFILGVCVCVCVCVCGILFFFIFFIIVHNLKVIIYLFYRNTSVLNTYNYKEGTSMTDSFLRMFTVINVSMCWWQLKLKACLWQALILPACVMITWMDSAEIWNNYEKKLWILMVNNSTNINKTNTKRHYIWRWKSRPWLGTGTKMWRAKSVNGIPTI